MPVVSIDLTLENNENAEASKKKIILRRNNDDLIDVQRDEYYTLTVGLTRRNHSKSLKAHSPMFLKGKDESWFLILGDTRNEELWALKRVSGINSQQRYHQLQFRTPDNFGKVNQLPYSQKYNSSRTCISLKSYEFCFTGPVKLTFYLISDCYIGLDQQYSICLNVTPSFV